MNTLSWMLYLSDIISNISILLVLSGIVFTALSLWFFMCGCYNNHMSHEQKVADYYYRKGEELDEEKKKRAANSELYEQRSKWWWGFVPRLVPWAVVLFILASVIPSKRTIYLIAASEFGETVATSGPATEIMDALKDQILDYLKPAPQEKQP